MAAITITVANVKYNSGGTGLLNRNYDAGATIGAGDAVALDGSNLWQPADSNASAILAGSLGYGIALHGALLDQPLTVVTGSGAIIDFGAVLTQWETYIIGATVAGDINPISDLTTGWYTTILGYASTTSLMVFQPTLVPGAHA